MTSLLRYFFLAIPCLLLVGGCVYDEPYSSDYYHHRHGYYRDGYYDRRDVVVYDRDRSYYNDRDRRDRYYAYDDRRRNDWHDDRKDHHDGDHHDHRDDYKKKSYSDSNGPKLRAQYGGGWQNQDSHGNPKKDDKKKKKKHDDD